MPGSIRENNTDLREFVLKHNIRTVLDVGPGRGTYANVLSGLMLTMDAVEIWRPYIRRYDLTRLYRNVIHGDIREHSIFAYDLVIFGDVLEHMTREEAMAVWERAKASARFVMMSVPIIHYPQGESHGNPYEAHVQDHLTPEDIGRDYGPFWRTWLYKTTGTFIAAGESLLTVPGTAVSGNSCPVCHARDTHRAWCTEADPTPYNDIAGWGSALVPPAVGGEEGGQGDG